MNEENKNACEVELRYFNKKDGKVYVDVANGRAFNTPVEAIQTFQGNMSVSGDDLKDYIILSVRFNYEDEKDTIHNNSLMTELECYERLKSLLYGVYVSEDVISCMENVNGKTVDNLKKILFWKTGMHDFDELEYYDESFFHEVKRFQSRLILKDRTNGVASLKKRDLMKNIGEREYEIVKNVTTWESVSENLFKLIDKEHGKFAIWNNETMEWVG